MVTSPASVLLVLGVAMVASSALPTATAFATPASTANSDIAVVGVGVLGTSLCKQLLDDPRFAGRRVTGITKSSARHGAVREQVLAGADEDDRLVLLTMDEALAQYSGESFKDVVFCAPPSGFEDYPKAVRDAATQLWSGTGGGGSFVFTSSGGVYEGKDGETVTETSPTLDPDANPRQGRLVNAEKECVASGGCALRLAGLYTLERGAHNFWLEKCPDGVKGREDGIVNLLHYDDAAGAALAALKVGPEVTSKQTFLISDGNPTTRRGICESALKTKRYSEYTCPPFLGTKEDLLGKVYDGTRSDEALKWRPKYASFDDFCTSELVVR
ncbi:hypothetical protein THAOC_07431 [Thalassiosira oceanica]|uniref:NAD-dependent epimerase/dehydratase domain-containing protein n=1 Tax=Thalassiosira oceanica TaxID=159749 RepID=K0T0D7_THAOC|nr:hypothetical protein THAOC_07431 [Thalassiosira oceanica]|mmetsp:Transcript_38567/g.92303  ORF Transcript_38567/g.92303 Transcript_38567/m.92303 type:complete len:329 (+) Transcript_38567:217-1203(+)|eukprot:EJK71155.1 hypothetical protein THAOC_07431 [Thalassiosira oceanica]